MSTAQLKLEVVLAAVDKMTRPLKQALAGSKGLATALKQTREQLGALKKAQSSIDAFRRLTRESKDIGSNLAGAKQRLEAVRVQMQQSGQASEKLARQFSQAEKAVTALTLAQRKKLDAARAAASALSREGIDTRQLAEHETRLKHSILSTNQSLAQQEAALARVGRRQQQLSAAKARYGKQMDARNQLAGTGAGAMAAGAATGLAMAAPIRAYSQAEDAAMQLRVSMMGRDNSVKKEYADINALAERLGNKLPGTTAELQDMMTMLNRQGMSAQAILGGVGEASAYLGVQLKLPYQTAAEYAAKMQDATGALESDMMGVMDTIQRTYQVGVDPSNMVAGFAKLSPVLDMIKQKGLAGAKTMAPLLAMADQASLVGESAGNAYRKVFQRSMDAQKIKKGNKLVAKSGVKLDFTNGKGEFGGLDKMFTQLAQLKRLDTQKRNRVIAEIWGDDAETLQALNVMIDKGQSGYRDMQQKMADQASLQSRVNAQLGTLANLWDAASGTFTNAMVRFGEALAPELKDLTNWIAELSEKLGNWAKANPALANTLMKIAGITAILLTAFGALALTVAAIMGPFVMANLVLGRLFIGLSSGIGVLGRIGTAFAVLGKVIAFVGRLFLLNPIGLAITAIAIGAFLIWKHWDTLGPKFAAMWEAIKGFFAQGWQTIKSASVQAFDWYFSLPGRFIELGAHLMQGLVQGITSKLGAVKEAITGAGAATVDWFKEKLGIHSPSRVFAELGGFTMQGLHQGIVGGQDGPLSAVLGMARRLTAAGAGIALGVVGVAQAGALDPRPPLRTGSPSVAVAPSPIQITIHAAPGMNEQQLAQLVAREVARLQNQQAARGRSKLGDYD